MGSRHRVIPIFIPQKACPYRCTYCNQFAIAGQASIPSPREAEEIICSHLATIPEAYDKRIAFFGGSFTGMSIPEQNEYLKVAHRHLRDGEVSGIQLSTRPDYITPEILQNLKTYGVTLIELGAQSLHDDILHCVNRGHTVRQVEEASRLILQHGFELGLQMMIGLPGDSKERALETAHKIVQFGASYTRIYPTLVVENTPLAKQYRDGQYQPLSLEQAVDWCKEIYQYFTDNNVNILRIGLHPSEGLLKGTDYLAGPFHVSFKELVLTEIWKERIQRAIKRQGRDDVTIEVPSDEINYAVGHLSANRKRFPNVIFKQSHDKK